jgi:hypothetical protein
MQMGGAYTMVNHLISVTMFKIKLLALRNDVILFFMLLNCERAYILLRVEYIIITSENCQLYFICYIILSFYVIFFLQPQS